MSFLCSFLCRRAQGIRKLCRRALQNEHKKDIYLLNLNSLTSFFLFCLLLLKLLFIPTFRLLLSQIRTNRATFFTRNFLPYYLWGIMKLLVVSLKILLNQASLTNYTVQDKLAMILCFALRKFESADHSFLQ